MKLKFTAGVIILLIAFILQFSLATAGRYFDLSFAALITLAFVLELWELIVLILVTVLVLNWQPAVSVELGILALFPIAVYFLRRFSELQLWIKNLTAILLGFILLYAAVAPRMLYSGAFLADLVIAMLFGTVALFSLKAVYTM